LPVSTDARIGSELLGYRIEALVGRGGMGVVYRAFDPRLKRNVALKLIAPELAADDRFRERFLAETEVAASLEHPNVVPIHDAGEVDGELALAMRCVEGSDLKMLLKAEGTLEPARALSLCAQIAGALDAAHAKGLVHRDVKPSNVLLDEREHVYLADFGLTRRLADQGIAGEQALSLGTPAYVAPEQILGEEVDGRADLYSLACLLYECLTGEPPFRRDSEMAVLWDHLHQPPPKASDRRPSLSPTVDAVVAKALAKDPNERYGSGAELVEAARRALPGQIGAPRRRRRMFVFLVLAGAAAALAVALPLTLSGGKSESSVNPALAVKESTKPTLAIRKPSLQRIDPRTNRLVATIPVGPTYPGGLALGGGHVWLADAEHNALYRVDPRTNSFRAVVKGIESETGLAFGGGSVWVLNTIDNTVSQLDPRSGTILHVVALPPGIAGGAIAANEERVWVAQATARGNLTFVNTSSYATGIVNVASGSLPAPNFGDVAIGQGALWAIGRDPAAASPTGGVVKLDPKSGKLLARVGAEDFRCACAASPAMLAAGQEGVWVVQSVAATASIAPSGDRVVRSVRAGSSVDAVAVGAGSVWMLSPADGTVTRVDPKTGTILKTFEVGPNPLDLVADENGVWVAVRPA
jgi:serine/threonine protein kinase/streptogramin lyase